MFLQAVNALKAALDVPADVPLSNAIHQMTKMMGLAVVDAEGHLISLPDQVERLVEATGVTFGSAYVDLIGPDPVDGASQDTATTNVTPASSSAGPLQQSEAPVQSLPARRLPHEC